MPKAAPSSRQFVNSACWSLMGTVVPMLAALAAVPWLMRYMGQERLGVLSLVWVVVGYFSFLDMGLGRAVTVAVAQPGRGATRCTPMKYMWWGRLAVLLMAVGVVMAAVLGLCVGDMGCALQAEFRRTDQ